MLANVLLGRPGYKVTEGDVTFNEESILTLRPDQRAQRGLFLAFQYPTEVPGVSVVNFLRTAYKAVKGEDDEARSHQSTDDAEDRQLSGHQKILPVTRYTTRNTATIAATK